MAVFAIIGTRNAPSLVEAASLLYGADFLKLSDSSFLVADDTTSQEVSAKLGLKRGSDNTQPASSAVVIAASSYWGHATTDVWEWINARWS